MYGVLLLLLCAANVAGVYLRAGSNATVRSEYWSSLRSSGKCAPSSHCEVPSGQTWILDISMEVETLKIYGTLKWDTEKDGLELRTGNILVQEGGHLQVGSKSNPMRLKATIYIKEGPYFHDEFGDRFLASVGEARVDIHGRPLARTWTLLSRTSQAGSNQLFLKHDPVEMGWQVGDLIGVATTSRGVSPEHRIQAIGFATEWRLGLLGVRAGVEKTAWGESAANAIDADLGSCWGSWCAPYCSGDEHWITVELEKQSLLKRVRLLWDKSRFSPVYTIEVLQDAGWMLATTIRNSVGGWDDVDVYHNASKIRITADYTSMSSRGSEPAWSGLKLYDLQVFGQELNHTPQNVIFLDRPLESEHWGGFRQIQDHSFEMAAEVVNLERNVVITGDHEDFESTHKGLHTLMSHAGIWDVRYARVEYCGQRHFMGKYCLHFHHGGHCADCVFQGNAIYQSAQLGITIHGTHRSLVDSNVLWDVQAAGIYTEDGNEMYNTVSSNVLICSWWVKCSASWNGAHQTAGIYLIAMTNNLIDNHIVGYENGIWTPGSIALFGQGSALGKVCPQNTPFGTIRGNVNHDNARYGLYLDNQHPRNIERDKNGFVTNMGTCSEFTADGEDNGASPASVVEDEFDWHNTYVGQYSMGDVSFLRLVSVNNGHDLYWKESKNFADKKSHHIRDSIFANDPLDPVVTKIATVAGPAGPFTFLVTNTTFIGGPMGCGALCAGQHCGLTGAGGPCNVQYLLTQVDFSRVQEGQNRITFGLNTVDLGWVQPMFMSNDDSLGGYRSIVSRHLNGFAKVNGCEATLGPSWDQGTGCMRSVRRMNFWSKDLGNLKLVGPGYEVVEDNSTAVNGMNAGKLIYEPMHGGYGAVVLLGENYSLEGPLVGDMGTELSDLILEQTFGAPEMLKLAVNEEFCELTAQDDRRFIGVHGPPPETYLPTSCLTQAYEAIPHSTQSTTWSTWPASTTDSSICAEESEVPCCPDGSCEGSCAGGSQCCPSPQGSRTCPSASVLEVPVCSLGKAFDCTGKTGIAPPGRTGGACDWPNLPAIPFYWDPWCTFGSLGCFADGQNIECRFCGVGDFAAIPCPTSDTTTSTSSVTLFAGCAALQGGLLPCSDDGCKVLAGGLMDRTCDNYCREHGLNCVGAWEDMDDDCNVMATLTCNQSWAGTPDLICECAPGSRAVWIQDKHGDCLMAKDFDRSGAQVDSHPCGNMSDEESHLEWQWIFEAKTQQFSRASDRTRCLHAAERAEPGSLLVMWPCDPQDPAQKWTFDAALGHLTVGQLCVDASPEVSLDGFRQAQIWTCDPEAESQRWHIQEERRTTTVTTTQGWIHASWGTPSGHQRGSLQHRSGGLCLAVESTSNGAELRMLPCDNSEAQLFDYDADLLQLRISAMCLDAFQGSFNGGKVHGWTCDPSAENQRFAYNAESGLIWNKHQVCLDSTDDTSEGSGVHMWACNPSNTNQQWIVVPPPAPPPPTVQLKLADQGCLAPLDSDESRSRLCMRECDTQDTSQAWLYDKNIRQIRNLNGKCLMAPHAGGIVQAQLTFTPVVAAENRACRGANFRDNARENYVAFLNVKTIQECKQFCMSRAICTAIEFNPYKERCEVWIKNVTTSVSAKNFTCLSASLADNTLAVYEPVDGGQGRVCRGDHAGDNSARYFTVSSAETVQDCEHKCAFTTGQCTGFEYHKTGRCELWSKPVGASAALSGYQCKSLATVLLTDCDVSSYRQWWTFNSSTGKMRSIEDGVCLYAAGDNRLRLLSCNAESSQRWTALTIQQSLLQRGPAESFGSRTQSNDKGAPLQEKQATGSLPRSSSRRRRRTLLQHVALQEII